MNIRLSVLVLLSLVLLPSASGAQIVSDQNRREALRNYRAGQEFLAGEQFEKAVDVFRKAIEYDPLMALAHYGLGQSYMALKRYASAIAAFKGCREAYEKLAGLALSDTVTANQQREDEILELRDAIRFYQSTTVKTASPDKTRYIVQLESRLRSLETVRQRNVDPSKPPAEVSLALGSAYFRNGDLTDAEREWKVAIATNPKFGEAHNNLAALFAMTGRRQQAEDSVRQAEKSGYQVNPRLKSDIQALPKEPS